MPETKRSVIVTVTDEKLPDIQRVAKELAATGMTVERVMPMTGVISGSCSSDELPAVEQVDGVMSVEEEAVAHLPPSGSPLQ